MCQGLLVTIVPDSDTSSSRGTDESFPEEPQGVAVERVTWATVGSAPRPTIGPRQSVEYQVGRGVGLGRPPTQIASADVCQRQLTVGGGRRRKRQPE